MITYIASYWLHVHLPPYVSNDNVSVEIQSKDKYIQITFTSV